MNKPSKALIIILVLSLFIIACISQKAMPTTLNLEDSIYEIIISKGENYNFLKDKIYIEYMEKLINQLTNKNSTLPDNYTLGNLNDDNIPELVIFNEKNPDDVKDEGSLEVYGFNESKYILLDTINMGFDISNYEMKIGNISEKQRGLLLNNNIGTHSGVTYGFILENGKLKQIINNKKVPLISLYNENEIKDINNDGILNFSVISIDPETENTTIKGSDKMTLWYQWNGEDSVDLVKVEKKDYSTEPSNKEIFNQAQSLIDNDFPNFLNFMIDNKNQLSKYDNTILIKDYIDKMENLALTRGLKINNLFSIYEKEQNINCVSGTHSINIDNLNSLEYLNREKVLKDNQDIKKNLINNINLGFKLNTEECLYYYLIDYSKFIDLFSENILNEYIDYLSILAFNSNEASTKDGKLVISQDKLIERILLAESFDMVYPYSELLDKVHNIYKEYIDLYFLGDDKDPNFDPDTKVIKKEILEEFKQTSKKYEFTGFSYIVKDFLSWIQSNNNMINDKIIEKLHNNLN